MLQRTTPHVAGASGGVVGRDLRWIRPRTRSARRVIAAEQGGKEGPLRRAVFASLSFVFALGVARAAHAEEIPRLDWQLPVHCMHNPRGELVRVQCDDEKHPRVCLEAPNHASDGTELRRTKECTTTEPDQAYPSLVRSGVRFVRAIAESPPGYSRSNQGRAYQVQFDLLKRVYVGAAWAPTFMKPDARIPTPPGFPLGRGRVEVGFEASVLSPRGRSRHDFRVLEGAVSFSDLHVSGLVFAYDYQQAHRRPEFWVTTFFGAPRVHPVSLPLGWGFRTFKIEDRPPGFRKALDLEMAEVHVSWNPWQSRDLYSHLRIEAGADVGRRLEDRSAGFGSGAWYVGPTGAVRSRLALGQGGLHYLFADLDWGRPTVVAGDLAGKPAMKLAATFAYELVLIAVNDQPFSMRLAATGGTHEDPATRARSVELGATAGLRFSFWAPPRSFEPLPELEDP
ncbi:hypothetical protein A7982_12094 [Minicystis rosea]|nr:hypothetical protein A7982_12094 [Minicystis rosea]